MDTQILEDIGLTNAEVKVYLTLLELGTTTAGPVIEKSGLQSSVVHLALPKLTSKGFLSVVKQGKRAHYTASNPQHVTEYLDEKKERFNELLPLLLAKQQGTKQSEVVSYRGIRGVKELLYELLAAGGTEHHTIGSSKKSLMIGSSWWIAYHKRRAEKNIKAKLLFNESIRAWAEESKYPKAEIKFTTTGFEPLTETIIRGDAVGIIIWSDEPLGILIKQREAAQSYETYFQSLWQITH